MSGTGRVPNSRTSRSRRRRAITVYAIPALRWRTVLQLPQTRSAPHRLTALYSAAKSAREWSMSCSLLTADAGQSCPSRISAPGQEQPWCEPRKPAADRAFAIAIDAKSVAEAVGLRPLLGAEH